MKINPIVLENFIKTCHGHDFYTSTRIGGNNDITNTYSIEGNKEGREI
jgi:hypothetical protein